MTRLIWVALYSFVLCQLPAGAEQASPGNDVGATAANSLGEPTTAKVNPALSDEASEISMHMTEYISAAPTLHMVAYGGNEAL